MSRDGWFPYGTVGGDEAGTESDEFFVGEIGFSKFGFGFAAAAFKAGTGSGFLPVFAATEQRLKAQGRLVDRRR